MQEELPHNCDDVKLDDEVLEDSGPTVQKRWIAGFWRRIAAFILDILVLALTGFILGIFFESKFVELSTWGGGRFIGLGIAVLYFGIMNSRLAGGQTLGKKHMKVMVVGHDGKPVGFGLSIVRAIILVLPYYINGFPINDIGFVPSLVLLTLFPLSAMLCIQYLFLFNSITRQSLHDILVKTYVVRAGVEKQEVGKIWVGHWGILAIVTIGITLLFVQFSQAADSDAYESYTVCQKQIQAMPEVSSCTSLMQYNMTNMSANGGSGKTVNYMCCTVWLNDKDRITNQALAGKISQAIYDNCSEAQYGDFIQVGMYYGYDIGIWSSWQYYWHRFPIEKQ